jgi:hypothetical protein
VCANPSASAALAARTGFGASLRREIGPELPALDGPAAGEHGRFMNTAAINRFFGICLEIIRA